MIQIDGLPFVARSVTSVAVNGVNLEHFFLKFILSVIDGNRIVMSVQSMDKCLEFTGHQKLEIPKDDSTNG